MERDDIVDSLLFYDMNSFSPPGPNNSKFFYLRYRLKSLNRGHRRHTLVLTTGTGTQSATVSAPRVLAPLNLNNEQLNEDDDDGCCNDNLGVDCQR